MTTGQVPQGPPATPLQMVPEGVPDSPQAPEQTPAAEPSLEQQISILKSENEKISGQRKAEQARFSKAQSESASLQELGDRLENLAIEVTASNAELRAGLAATAAGNVEGMSGVMDDAGGKIRADAQATLRTSDYNGLKRQMEVFMDDQEAVGAWQTEVQAQNNGSDNQTLSGFREILSQAKDRQHTAQLEAKDVEIAATRENVMKEFEVEDVNTGPAASASGTPSLDQLSVVNLKKTIAVGDLEKHKEDLLAAIRKGPPPGT